MMQAADHGVVKNTVEGRAEVDAKNSSGRSILRLSAEVRARRRDKASTRERRNVGLAIANVSPPVG